MFDCVCFKYYHGSFTNARLPVIHFQWLKEQPCSVNFRWCQNAFRIQFLTNLVSTNLPSNSSATAGSANIVMQPWINLWAVFNWANDRTDWTGNDVIKTTDNLVEMLMTFCGELVDFQVQVTDNFKVVRPKANWNKQPNVMRLSSTVNLMINTSYASAILTILAIFPELVLTAVPSIIQTP